MARKLQRVDSYPPQFKRLIIEAEKSPEYSFPCPKDQKITTRTMLAKYLKAIRTESEEWQATQGQKNRPTAPWCYAYYIWASRTSIGETPDGIRFYPRAEGKIAQILEQALIDQGAKSTNEVIIEQSQSNPKFLDRLIAVQEMRDWKPKTKEETDKELEGPLNKAHRLIDENGDPINPKEQK